MPAGHPDPAAAAFPAVPDQMDVAVHPRRRRFNFPCRSVHPPRMDAAGSRTSGKIRPDSADSKRIDPGKMEGGTRHGRPLRSHQQESMDRKTAGDWPLRFGESLGGGCCQTFPNHAGFGDLRKIVEMRHLPHGLFKPNPPARGLNMMSPPNRERETLDAKKKQMSRAARHLARLSGIAENPQALSISS